MIRIQLCSKGVVPLESRSWAYRCDIAPLLIQLDCSSESSLVPLENCCIIIGNASCAPWKRLLSLVTCDQCWGDNRRTPPSGTHSEFGSRIVWASTLIIFDAPDNGAYTDVTSVNATKTLNVMVNGTNRSIKVIDVVWDTLAWLDCQHRLKMNLSWVELVEVSLEVPCLFPYVRLIWC